MIQDAVINVPCPKCTTPLLAFRQTKQERAEGRGTITNYSPAGAKIILIPKDNPIARVVCYRCGAEAPFESKYLRGE